jgi:cytochrome c oxidase subunit II
MLHSVVEPAGPFAVRIAWLFWVVVGVASVVYAVVIGFLVHAIRRRRAGVHDGASPVVIRSIGVAAGLTAVILLGLGIGDFVTSRAWARSPGDAMRVRVTAHQWWWEVEYLDGVPAERVRTANELHIPVGKPVALELISDDVIHSFWVPSLQGKKDLLPGYATNLQIVASRAGMHRGQCAEFCGFQHANMAFVVQAHEPQAFVEWRNAQLQPAREPGDATQAKGRDVFMGSTCPQCHTITGTDAAAMLGPDLTHVASRSQIAAGTLPNDPAHLASWIRDPQTFKPGTRMPSSSLAGDDLSALVAYLSNLK